MKFDLYFSVLKNGGVSIVPYEHNPTVGHDFYAVCGIAQSWLPPKGAGEVVGVSIELAEMPQPKEQSTMFYAYPTSLNQDAIVKIGKAFVGQIDLDTAHAAWDIVGFALSQFTPQQRQLMRSTGAIPEDEAKQYLDDLAAGKMHLDPIKLFKIALMVISMLAA